jgi:RHS repeat-associated protein
VAIESSPAVPSDQRKRLEFTYDSQSRRISKKVFDGASARSNFSLQPSAFSLFVYDGWNLLAELTSDLRPLTSFVWGLDLSGSQQGAGGVGGLLFISDRQAGPGNSHALAYDANGNVVALVDSQTGKISAQYNHGPFGESLKASGSMAKTNPFRFSTKYTDDETDLVYYGYRYYRPVSGRWISRDTIEERGGNNIYNFVCNNPISRIDMFGLWPVEVHQDFLDSWLPIGYNSYNCGNCCKLNVRALLKASSDAADSWWNQLDGDANEHAMGNYGPPTQTPEQAQAGYDGFIATKLEIANSLANQARSTASAYTKCNLRKQALAELGRAHHAYADSYSPSHVGFQTWLPLSYFYYDLFAWYGYINAHQSQETMSVYQSLKSGIDFFLYTGELSNILQP